MRGQLVRDIEDVLQKQTWYQHPKRYVELFLQDQSFPDGPMVLPSSTGEEVGEEEVTDIADLDAYFDNVENAREVTGDQFASVMGPEEGWF